MAAHDAIARGGNCYALHSVGSDYSVEASKWRRNKQ